MKKLLVLALVLSVATMANAALVINTTTTGPLAAGETATLSISTDAIIGYGVGDWAGAALVVDTAAANIAGGIANPALNEPGLNVYQNMEADYGLTPPTYPQENGVGFMVAFTGANVAAGATLFQDIVYTAGTVGGPITVTLWGTQDWGTYEILGTTIINQIPEPMTLGLLGLGGLFLRRRK